MIQAAQVKLAALGQFGCYFISLAYLAEQVSGVNLNLLKEFDDARYAGYVGDDAFILDAGKVFTMLTHGAATYEVWKAGDGHPLPLDYKLLPGEREILRFEYTDSNERVWAHFVVGDGSGHCAYDPEGSSNSVEKGKVVSRRIIRSV